MRISDITTKSIIHEGVYFLKPGQLRGSWRDSELRKLGFKQAKNGGWFTDRSNWDKLEKMGERNWRSLLSEEKNHKNAVSPTVYHGNQGGIHGELTAPMWWTEIKDDALLYVRQGGDIDMEGWLLTAKIKCKKPYIVGKNQETNTVLADWERLAKKGYDCIHDAEAKDWIPFYSKDITLLDTEYVSAPDTKGAKWIRKVYDMFPEHPFDSNHRYIEFDEGDGVFELSFDDNTESGAVISFIQAYPHEHTPQVINDLETKTIQKLQDLARQDGISLLMKSPIISKDELTEGKVSVDRAIQFFKHFHQKYGGKPELNLWKVSRITNTKYRDLERELHQRIARGDVPKEFAFRKDLITLESITVQDPSDNDQNDVFYNDEKIGYIMLSPANDQYGWLELDLPNPLAIADVKFDPQFRGKGYMSELLNWLEDYARGLGYQTLFLRVDDDSEVDQQSLHAMYRKLGFEDYNNEYVYDEMNGLYMYKPIGGQTTINEAPLPPDWDEEVYRGKGTFKNRIQYALDRAKKIGAGSSRVAFIIEHEGRPTVLKIAKNKKGLAQNNVEASILDDHYAQSLGIVIPLIDYDTENPEPLWIHTELAEKATEKKLCDIMKCPGILQTPNSKMSAGGLYVLVDLAKIITGKYTNVTANEQLQRIQERTGMSDQDLATLEEYASRLADLSVNFDLILGDVDSARNWGIYKGKPVIIDIGLSSDVYTSMYKKR